MLGETDEEENQESLMNLTKAVVESIVSTLQ